MKKFSLAIVSVMALSASSAFAADCGAAYKMKYDPQEARGRNGSLNQSASLLMGSGKAVKGKLLNTKVEAPKAEKKS